MITINNYERPKTLEDAYTLLQKNKKNKVLGGMMWLRLGSQTVPTAIDLSDLGLDQVVETEDTIEIGSMCTLRQLETHPLLEKLGDGVLAKSVEHIVGTQFRNSATVGGSIFGRYGFSDILTAFLALDTTVHLYHKGPVALADFVAMPLEKDILTKLTIKKQDTAVCYLSERLTQTDFPLLTVAVSKTVDQYKIIVGARPQKAAYANTAMALLDSGEKNLALVAQTAVEELCFGTNMRGTKAYRQALAKVLIKRGLQDIEGR